MPTGSVKLQSIKRLGQENHSYEVSDEEPADSYMTMTSSKKDEKAQETQNNQPYGSASSSCSASPRAERC
ncbi:unnamed protein product [Pleuronectes platessa]|uniref:Uncharacterized protein n=1 Tax=Pleuronectes platessa TaxID=8262 RepID=A0A9N7Z6Z9_PLEPL|nr:unnamed protein product [Pleuronectes platessa]